MVAPSVRDGMPQVRGLYEHVAPTDQRPRNLFSTGSLLDFYESVYSIPLCVQVRARGGLGFQSLDICDISVLRRASAFAPVPLQDSLGHGHWPMRSFADESFFSLPRRG